MKIVKKRFKSFLPPKNYNILLIGKCHSCKRVGVNFLYLFLNSVRHFSSIFVERICLAYLFKILSLLLIFLIQLYTLIFLFT